MTTQPGTNTNLQPSVRVAISTDFLDAFCQIPQSQQSKVRRFVEKFKADPRSSGINYEKIEGAADENLRSVRIDQAYRGIVLKPESGNVYALLWVDNHDDDYKWAMNKVYSIHPETGALQVLPVEQISEQLEDKAEEAEQERTGLYREYRDRELARLGIPQELMALVRSVNTEEDLDLIETHLPQEAYEALFLLAAGDTLREVDREMAELRQQRAEEEIDTSDYAAAFDNPDSQRRFHVVEDELELAEILSAPLEKWRVFLHPSQRRLVQMNANGPIRVLGGAGTGKTVVAMHRANYLVENVFDEPEQRLLFTTFTVNLAADIEENLAKICSDDVLERIEVVNLDKWVTQFLRKQGYDYSIDYGARTETLWENALDLRPSEMDLTRSFYRDEWEQVIQPQEIMSLNDYLRVSRVGRVTPLGRRQRKAIWPVFEEYRTLLDENRLREADGAMRDARLLLERQGNILPYRSIVVDEAQDLGRQALMLLRAMVPEYSQDIFIVGDAHQRIYRHPITLSDAGIDIVGRGQKLRINYRTTEENRRWAVNSLRDVTFDDLDGGVDEQTGYRSLMHGVDPEVHPFDTFSDEIRFLVEYLSRFDEEGLNQVCVVARTGQLLDQYEGAIRANSIPTYSIRRTRPEDRSAPGVRLATMHRVKGLEFERVVITGANDDVIPLSQALAGAVGDSDKELREKRERSLLYVAATRARSEVHVTCHGTPSRYL